MIFYSSRLFLYSIAVAMCLQMIAAAQITTTEDWPCIQRLVPEISSHVIWSGPDLEGIPDALMSDRSILDTARKLSNQRTSEAEVEKTLDEYVSKLPEAERNLRLTALFATILSDLNKTRNEFINGIKRYTRHQSGLSEKIESLLNEAAVLEKTQDTKSNQRKSEVSDTLNWLMRMFKEREKSIIQLCEQPVEIEQRAGELARAIAFKLN